MVREANEHCEQNYDHKKQCLGISKESKYHPSRKSCFSLVYCLNHEKDQLSSISSCYVNLIRSKGHIKSTRSKGSEGSVGSTESTALISKIDVFGLEFF